MFIPTIRVSPRAVHYHVISRHFSVAATLFYHSKVSAVSDAVKAIQPGSTVLAGGFGLSGIPSTIIDELKSHPNINDLTVVSNNAAVDGRGLSLLLESGQITKMISSYIGGNKFFESKYLNGEIDLELVPQGTIAERVRAGGAGIPAFYTPAGVNTWIEQGKIPVRYSHNSPNNNDKSNDKKILKTSSPRESRTFNGRKYILEEAIVGDAAIIKAYKADKLGNAWFRGAAQNFNSAMARASNYTIVEAEHIVEPGEILPENVHLPGVYVSKVIQSTTPKEIEIYKFADPKEESVKSSAPKKSSDVKRTRIVKRAAQEFKDGDVVNLGIGIPTLIPNHLPAGVHVTLQSENGILGLGPYPHEGEEDPDFINAGKETVTLAPGSSLFGSEESFAMIRAGKINVTVLGAMQVSKYGDLANWALPNMVKGMGGAMDLVSNPAHTKVVIVMEHNDKKGRSKILNECKFPLTGSRCVSKIVTDLAVFDVDPEKGLTLVEILDDITVKELQQMTEAEFVVSENLKPYNV